MRCPNCKKKISIFKAGDKFDCPSCHIHLRSSAIKATIGTLLAWYPMSLLFIWAYKVNFPLTDLLVGILSFLLVGLPIWLMSIRIDETKT